MNWLAASVTQARITSHPLCAERSGSGAGNRDKDLRG